MKTSLTRRAIALACVLLIAAALGLAQAGRGVGRLAGTVKDEAGNPIAGAMVVMEYEKGGRRDGTTTNDKGEWAFLGTGTGRAKLTFGAEGRQCVILFVMVRQLEANKPVHVVLRPMAMQPQADDPAPKAERSGPAEVVTRTYTLRFISPESVQEALRVYFLNCSYDKESSLISVVMEKKNVAAFEEQLRRLDVEKKSITLRIFTVIAAKEGKSDAIENKDLKRVLAEVSDLLNFKSYVLDGASAITVRDGAAFGRLALSSTMNEGLRFDYKGVTILTGSGGKRSVKLGFWLQQLSTKQELLGSETEIAEDGYLVAGVSRIGSDGKSLVLVINAEIH